LDFLDTDVFNITVDHCSAFLNPMIDSWDIDLKTFGMGIALNKALDSTPFVRFQFVETEGVDSSKQAPGFLEFLRNAALSGDASREELEFLRGLRFLLKSPSALYYYRELQSLRDPLHFPENHAATMHKHRDAEDVEKLMQVESRKHAIRRWARHRKNPRKTGKAKVS